MTVCSECNGTPMVVTAKDPDTEWWCPECGGTGKCRSCGIPGAPAHDPSPRCHYNRTITHCTCRACFG